MRQKAIDAVVDFMSCNLEDSGEHWLDLDGKFAVVFDFRTDNLAELHPGSYDVPPHYVGEIRATATRAMLVELDTLGVIRGSEDITKDIPPHREWIG